MDLKERVATVMWLGLALTASFMASPAYAAQGHVGDSVTGLVTGEAQGSGDMSSADRRVPESPSRPDFSGRWTLNAKASDDPLEKAREAMQASGQPRGAGRGMGGGSGGMGRGRGMGGGRQGRGGTGGASGDGSLSSGELSALLTPAQALHVTHEDPMLLIADERGQRQRLFTDFRGASVSASGGLQQRVAVAGWEGAVLVVETTMLGKKLVQGYQIDSATGQLVVSSAVQLSAAPPVSYRLVYDRLKPGVEGTNAGQGAGAAREKTR